MAEDWKKSGIAEDYKPREKTEPLKAGIANATSDKIYQGTDDKNKIPLESFEMCKHMDYDYNSEDHPAVWHKCKYRDMNGVCTRETCVFDTHETPKVANAHWDTCILCGRTLNLSPNMMDVPICDLCRGRLLFAEKKEGFDCLLCGQHQSRPSKAPFSQICDDCFINYIFCPNCLHWSQVGTSPAEGYDKL